MLFKCAGCFVIVAKHDNTENVSTLNDGFRKCNLAKPGGVKTAIAQVLSWLGRLTGSK
jgi:hypothetical protein